MQLRGWNPEGVPYSQQIKTDNDGNLFVRSIAPLSVTVTNPTANPAVDATVNWQSCTTSNITNNIAVEIQPANAGKVLCCTGLQFYNVAALVSSEIQLRSGTTVLWRSFMPANMQGPQAVQFLRPIQGLVGLNLNVLVLTTGTSTVLNAQGYIK